MDNVIQVQFRKEVSFSDMLVDELTDKLMKYTDNPPQNRQEYLMFAKDMLIDEDYRDLLCGIMDVAIYEELEPKMKEFVELYYNMEG